jgi:hypothetical protein
MSNLISSPYADYIQEQKKQKYLKNIDVLMISSYHVEFYKVIIELQKSIINTLHKNNNKILNKNILEKINYGIIHNLNVRRFADNIQELEKWEKIKSSSYDIQYRIDQINNLKKELDNFVKLFDDSEGYKHSNYTIMELIKDHPKHSDNMKSYLRKQDEFLISYDEFKKQNR